MCSAFSSASISTSDPSALKTSYPNGVVGRSKAVTALIRVLCEDKMLESSLLVRLYILVGGLCEPRWLHVETMHYWSMGVNKIIKYFAK